MLPLFLPVLVMLAIIIPISFFQFLQQFSLVKYQKVKIHQNYQFWEVNHKRINDHLFDIQLGYIIQKETLISLILGVYLKLSLKYSRVFEGENIQIWINLEEQQLTALNRIIEFLFFKNRVDQMAEIFHNQIQRFQKATPNLQSEKYIKDDSEE
ncbi:unnamed protein product [Paramecium pentaurelia]|uniref:Uncharacterized protein n=1 Tax=Paramecium pentaurelia TaxID=43138 RepID=A0A8S1UM14_9CILI|nr:unnamed protein product [Paramecium pentaurelia]